MSISSLFKRISLCLFFLMYTIISCGNEQEGQQIDRIKMQKRHASEWKTERERIRALEIKSKIEWGTYADSNQIQITSKSLFDRNGDLIQKTSYDADGNAISKSSFQYNEHGERILRIKYGNSGQMSDTTIYKYEHDDHGNIIFERIYDSSLNNIASFKYFNDGNNNLVRKRSRIWQGIYPHDKYGNETDKALEIIYNTNGVTPAQVTRFFKHDNYGKRLESIIGNPGGGIDDRTIYEYDDHGNLIAMYSIDYYSRTKWETDLYVYAYDYYEDKIPLRNAVDVQELYQKMWQKKPNRFPELIFLRSSPEPNLPERLVVNSIVKTHDFFDKNNNKDGKGINNRFVIMEWNKQEVVFDSTTNLTWESNGSGAKLNYYEAQHYVAELNNNSYCDFNDWRLPTLTEAMSLVEPIRASNDLHINSVFNSNQRVIWTSDGVRANIVWFVQFDPGFCYYGYDSNEYYVRAVR